MRAPLKRFQRFACAVLVAASFQGIQSAHADWANFGTVSMTDATHPKLTNGYGCSTDGRDIICDNANSAVSFGTGGLLDYGGLTVMGGISASAVSSTYVSATVLQINPSTMPCSTGLNGTIRYSSTSNTLEVCAGTTWSTLSSNTTPGNVAGGGSATAVAIWSGVNSLTYESNTTSGLYWDRANGRLGVGTNAPQASLYVSASSAIVGIDNASVGNSGVVFYQTGVSKGVVGVPGANGGIVNQSIAGDLVQRTNQSMLFSVDGGATTLMKLTSTSLVGINTVTPTATLQVSGTFTVSNSAQLSDQPSLYVGSNGRVGIRTSSPKVPFEVSGSAWFTNVVSPGYSGAVNFVVTSDTTRTAYNRLTIGSVSPSNMFVETADASNNKLNLYLQPFGGNVGIGGYINPPASSLTVVGGEIQTGSSGAACTTATNGGAIRYSAGTLYYCNGSNTWASITGGGAGFTGGGSATAIAFWNGPSSLTYESATTSGLYWDHVNGRLGIGTNSPTTSIDVVNSNGAAYVNATAYRENNLGGGLQFLHARGMLTSPAALQSGDFGGSIFFKGYDGGAFQNMSSIQSVMDSSPVSGSSLTGALVFSTATSTSLNLPLERMRISSLGNVGIGNIPTPTATLQVSGTLVVSQTGQDSLTSASLVADSRGISVSSIVHINGSAFSPIGAGGNAILSGTTAVSTSSAGSITFYTGGNQRMGIDNSGKVGIGTGIPTSPLTVSGSMIELTNGFKTLKLQTSGGSIDFRGNNADLYINNFPGPATPSNTYINPGGGYVGIGTALPSSKLTISGDSSAGMANNAIEINDTGASGRLYSMGSRGATGFVLGDETAHVARMIIAPNGVFTLAGTSTCTLANGTGTTSCTSDRRLKERIAPITGALDKLMLIKGVTFHWKRKDISKPEHIGVIAQDVEKAFPQAVTEVSDTTIGTAKTVDYAILVAPIIEVLREFKGMFDADHKDISKLRADNENLRVMVDTQQKQIDALTAANDNLSDLKDQVKMLRSDVRGLQKARP